MDRNIIDGLRGSDGIDIAIRDLSTDRSSSR